MTRLHSVYAGHRGARAGWRVLAFFGLWLGGYFGLLLLAFALGLPENGGMWAPSRFFPMEAINLAAVVFATLVMARVERLTIITALKRWGMPLRGRGSDLWEGLGWGALSMSVLIGSMWLLGGYVVGGWQAVWWQLVGALLMWGLGFMALGLAEEMLFRAYPLATARQGLRFWPAALVLSVVFSAFHAGKEGENGVDLMGLVVFGLFACFTVWRTGAIWFAVGFHAAFNFFGLVLYSGPNAGELLPGRLLDAQFPGPAWLTGGSLGPEASVLVFPLFAAMFGLFHIRHPRAFVTSPTDPA
jgi:membrane protease YdiL (CAAX protease family)